MQNGQVTEGCATEMSFGEGGVPGAYTTNAPYTPVAHHSVLNTLQAPDPAVPNGLRLAWRLPFHFWSGCTGLTEVLHLL